MRTIEPDTRQLLRRIPSVATVLSAPELADRLSRTRPELATAIVQDVIARVRSGVLAGDTESGPDDVVPLVAQELGRIAAPRLRPVINGTGVIIHTNLGRAPIATDVAETMAEVAGHYTPLELQLETGRRGGRMAEITRLMRLLTGAEATLVVNNNAAAVLLALSALCAGRDVILSRSQAVEIGGGFRVPDVMAQGGAQLIEVGTTNRTYARDYERAITDQTAALLTVHWSNFKIIGFTAQPSLGELADVAHRHGLPLIEDLGSGAVVDTAPFGLNHEPTIGESIAAGVDVVCASGDKLLGGPQAGIICGGKELVDRVAAHPLARAVRADKTCLAGLAATLRHYVAGDYPDAVPVWWMLSQPLERLEVRCDGWLAQLQLRGVGELEVVPSLSAIGGGSLPGETLPSRAVAISTARAREVGLTLDQIAARLRSGNPALMPHVAGDRLLVDARTVLHDEDEAVIDALATALGRG